MRRNGRNGKAAYIRWSAYTLILWIFAVRSPSTSASPGSDLASVLQPYVDRRELAGAVMLVASRNKVISLNAVGYADIDAKRLMRTDALFWIASMSKPIAATAVMMLVDEGKIRLDDSADKYLAGFAPRIMTVAERGQVRLERSQHPVTIRSLLSHTSGIPYRSSLETPTLDVLPLGIRVQSYALEPLQFEPGSDFAYSNGGINAAARIVEVVSGMSIQHFLQERLFTPLGMRDTTFWPTQEQIHRLAKSYQANASGTDLEETAITQLRYPLTNRKERYPIPAGGLFSTADDLGRFCQMILSGGVFHGRRLLSVAAIQEMTRNQLSGASLQEINRRRRDSGDPDGYGLGWYTYGLGIAGHTGAYSTEMRIDVEHGLATVWLGPVNTTVAELRR